MSNHSSVLNARYKSIVSTRKKSIWQNVKVCSCADMPHGAGHVRTRLWTCPVYFSTRDNLPGHLAICVNNIIIMCIGLVHDIFTRNIYYALDREIDN